MTSPEGRLRCGRPSTFVPAILPPPINSNFGASPTRFSLSSWRILLPSSRGPSPRFVYAFPHLFLFAQLISLPRSDLTSCAFVHMSHRPIVSTGYLSSFYLSTFRTYFSSLPPPLPSSLFDSLSLIHLIQKLVRHFFACETG